MQYKITKLSIKENPENKKSEEDIQQLNEKIVEKYNKLDFISGGFYAVETGMSFTGNLRKFPEIDEPAILTGGEWFHSTPLTEITQVSKHSWIFKTRNSIYSLEALMVKKLDH